MSQVLPKFTWVEIDRRQGPTHGYRQRFHLTTAGRDPMAGGHEVVAVLDRVLVPDDPDSNQWTVLFNGGKHGFNVDEPAAAKALSVALMIQHYSLRLAALVAGV